MGGHNGQVEQVITAMEESDRESPSLVSRDSEGKAINMPFKSKRKQLRCLNCNISGEMIRHGDLSPSTGAWKYKEYKKLVTGHRITQLDENQLGPFWRMACSVGVDSSS